MKRFAAVLRLVSLIAGLLASACACKNKHDTGPGGGTGSDGGGAATCDGIKVHVEKLYRAEAEAAAKPERIDETVADNLAMVMTDCAAAPTQVAPCAGKARSVAELEERCLIPLDEAGSEGERFR